MGVNENESLKCSLREPNRLVWTDLAMCDIRRADLACIYQFSLVQPFNNWRLTSMNFKNEINNNRISEFL
jgi:hypothetical protein